MDNQHSGLESRPQYLVQAWRQYHALSQADLAQLSGVARETINRLEQHRRPPQPTTIRKLAKAFGIKPHQLSLRPPKQLEFAQESPDVKVVEEAT